MTWLAAQDSDNSLVNLCPSTVSNLYLDRNRNLGD